MLVLGYDRIALRSDPNGLRINYSLESAEPITRLEITFEGDGETSKVITFPAAVGTDGRYFPGLFVKATRPGGPYPLIVTAQDALGRRSSARCAPGVTVF